ncbi:hypothetical protein [Bythopirellula goksoeyrii]|uniref:Alginate lyase domain-containing protein n=1 Tax=Bythopirellula goksoeyrii TaxID=1400387 RepID=A0A5B9QGI1_9BACT|nr:hypothetical protein [Bythopirellula goksoeyrii]QEG36036.1 hypothetical protein Pr1d_33450 [Bythopirellula goksoeyrii]
MSVKLHNIALAQFIHCARNSLSVLLILCLVLHHWPALGDEIPELQGWESKMIHNGKKWGEYLNPENGHSVDERLGAQYYDSQWVFYQIADYTGNREPWYTYASYARQIYFDEYLIPNEFRAQGYRRFPEGLYQDFRRGGKITIESLRLIRDMPAFSTVDSLTRGPDHRSGYSEVLSREVAYTVGANILAEKAGLNRVHESDGTPRLKPLVSMMENHLWQWRTQDFSDSDISRVAPFMMGLTAYALIEFHEWEVQNNRDPTAYWPQTHWPTIQSALYAVFTWLHDEAMVISSEDEITIRMWVPMKRIGYATFRYMDRTIPEVGAPTPAPDLNLLVAHVYYWLFYQTGEEQFKSIGDQLFAGGVRYGSPEWSGKHFNQLYRLSFKAFDWRAARTHNKTVRPDHSEKVVYP